MALEQAKCSNCGGPVGMVGSMLRCEYCKSAYFPPVQCEANGDGEAGTASTFSTTTTLTSSTCSRSWSTMSTRLEGDYPYPSGHHGWTQEEKRQGRIETILEERQRRIEARERQQNPIIAAWDAIVDMACWGVEHWYLWLIGIGLFLFIDGLLRLVSLIGGH